MDRRLKAVVALVAAALLLTGCSFDVYKLPLPGGADVGSDPITVTAQFRDVLDLVPDSTVKVHDVTVGKITDISLGGYTAQVTMQLRNDTRLPDNAVATIQQTSLLGEKFVRARAAGGGRQPEPARERRHHPDRPHRPEPRGRAGARRAQPAAERRRDRPAADHHPRARPDARTAARAALARRSTRSAPSPASSTGTSTTSSRRSRPLDHLSRSLNRQRTTIDATLDQLPSALRSINSQRRDLVRDAPGAVAPQRGRRPRDQAVQGRRRSTPCDS